METETEGRNVSEIVEHARRLTEKIKPLVDELPEEYRLVVLGFYQVAESLTELEGARLTRNRDRAHQIINDLVTTCANLAVNIAFADPEGIDLFCQDIRETARRFSGNPTEPRQRAPVMYA